MTKKFKTVDDAIGWAEEELEGANWHSEIEMPRKVFNAVKRFVNTEDHVKVATAIAKAIVDSI